MSVASVKQYFYFWETTPLIQPHITGLTLFLVQLRFFFSLKVTRLFGPFTKLIRLIARDLAIWLLFTSLLLLLTSIFFSTLLS